MDPKQNISAYLVEEPRFPYCKGCGHTQVVRALNEALLKLQFSPADVNVTTDIGCVGLADALFKGVHTVHTTHGRSTAFAVGTAIADRVLADGRLRTIVMIGDGGATIGLLHIVHAAQVNADVTVLLHNNFLFGMTGGQCSGFSPVGFVTTTTMDGNIVPPLDICQLVQSCGAGFVARKFATDRDLADTLAEAIAHPGFALVEIAELCTAYGTKLNDLSGKRLKETVDSQGFQTVALVRRSDRKEFALLYKEKFPQSEAAPTENFVPVKFRHNLTKRVGLIISGTAGERVQSSARLLCQAAVMSGLHATQKNDNLVTQGSGFSLSEVCLSPEPILYTGIDDADGVIVVSEDGLKELGGRRLIESLSPDALLIIDAELLLPQTRARVIRFALRRLASGKMAAATGLGLFLKLSKIFPLDAYTAAVKDSYGDEGNDTIKALDKVLCAESR
jgi:2-oxoglutarate ferredoxin oxidoreductase subunit beta